MRDLEEMLQKERQARELAEEVAKRLELQSETRTNGQTKSNTEGSIIEEAFEPPLEVDETKEEKVAEPNATVDSTVDPHDISDSTLLLERRLETMLADMQEMRAQLESFKLRAETAESERDTDRKTLAEMVEKIRLEESARRSSSTERARSPSQPVEQLLNGKSESVKSTIGPLLEKSGLANGDIPGSTNEAEPVQSAVGTLSRPPSSQPSSLYSTTPYVSMLGVVLIGMGVMAYLNGWQPPKVDR
jgi:hypothetical protein